MSKETKRKNTQSFHLERLLVDFKSDARPKVIWVKTGPRSKTARLAKLDLPGKLYIWQPFIVFIMFVRLKQFRYTGYDEKTLWEIPIKYKGVSFVLTHTKFGFGIMSNYKDNKTKKLGAEAVTVIRKAIPFAESLYEPAVQKVVNEGNISLHNHYRSIDGRYQFFRKKAENEFRKAKARAVKDKSGFVIPDDSAGYYITAMIDSFFSRLEHLLVLLLPFSNARHQFAHTLESFIAFNWKSKYKAVLMKENHRTAQLHLTTLDQIKEEFRNPLAHGYLLKHGHSFMLHDKDLGLFPMILTNSNRKITYYFHHASEKSFSQLCKALDSFDRFLKKDKRLKYGLMFVEADLSVAYDRESALRYDSAMSSMRKFSELIDHHIRMATDAENMDW